MNPMPQEPQDWNAAPIGRCELCGHERELAPSYLATPMGFHGPAWWVCEECEESALNDDDQLRYETEMGGAK